MLINTLIQKINADKAKIQGISASVLRLDRIHPVVSGNKIFKLKHYINAATHQKKQLVTFGGPYSNHLVATAYAGQQYGIRTTGYVRGERPPALSVSLQDCIAFGMDLKFVERDQYKQLQEELIQKENKNAVVVPYGGYGRLGAMGAKEILSFDDVGKYDIIMASCGSGTMAAGLLSIIGPHQKLILVSAVKNNFSIYEEIKALLIPEEYADKNMEIHHNYHFGGFAKKNSTLLNYMNDFYRETGIPTDFVYTGKLMFAFNEMLNKEYFPAGSNILLVHSGGLQGNRSLATNELIF